MYRTQDGSYSAYMCRKCKFRPSDHGWCFCLQCYNGEEQEDGKGSVNNACHKCGWLVNNISQWPNGTVSFQLSVTPEK